MNFAKFVEEADARDQEISPEARIANDISDKLDYLVSLEDAKREEKSVGVRSVCQVTSGFEIVKSSDIYSIAYRGTFVWDISGYDLKHGVFGGKDVPTNCADNRHTSQWFGMIVGWKLDMLIAFGIVNDGKNFGLQALHWYPRDGRFHEFILRGENQIFVRYGRNGDLRTRICWNTTRDNEWAFSPDQRTGQYDPCTKTGRPYGPNQYFVKID